MFLYEVEINYCIVILKNVEIYYIIFVYSSFGNKIKWNK